jgi:hypothetical protein
VRDGVEIYWEQYAAGLFLKRKTFIGPRGAGLKWPSGVLGAFAAILSGSEERRDRSGGGATPDHRLLVLRSLRDRGMGGSRTFSPRAGLRWGYPCRWHGLWDGRTVGAGGCNGVAVEELVVGRFRRNRRRTKRRTAARLSNCGSGMHQLHWR